MGADRDVQTRLKYLLFALVMLAGQTLAVSVASAHDIDPAHTVDECAVCLTVQALDTPPPAISTAIVPPEAFHWTVQPITLDPQLTSAPLGALRARAPPR